MDRSLHSAFLVSEIALWVTFALSVGFVVVYGFSRWWEHESGRNMMAFEVALALVTGMTLSRLIFDEHDWYAWLRTCIFIFVPITLAWRLWMLIRVQYFSSLDDDDVHSRRYDGQHDREDQAQSSGHPDDGVHHTSSGDGGHR